MFLIRPVVRCVTYHNNSPHALGYFWIQLEQNLFNPDSLGARSHTPAASCAGGPTFEGGYTIPWIRSGGRVRDFEVYDTLARVELPEPRSSRARSWSTSSSGRSRCRPTCAGWASRTVEQGKIFELAQWFPHACNYDDVHGWNTLPYLGTGEFYTNFGDYPSM
jgi:hypothetical protein